MKMGQAKVEIVKLTNLSLRRRQEEAVFFYILQGEAQYQVCFEEHRMHVDDFTLVNPTEFYTLSAEKTTECILADYMGVERDAWALGKMGVINEIYKQMIENHSRKDCMQYIIGNMYYTPEYVNRIYRAFTGSSFQEGVNNVRCWASEADLIMTREKSFGNGTDGNRIYAGGNT